MLLVALLYAVIGVLFCTDNYPPGGSSCVGIFIKCRTPTLSAVTQGFAGKSNERICCYFTIFFIVLNKPNNLPGRHMLYILHNGRKSRMALLNIQNQLHVLLNCNSLDHSIC